MIDSVIRLIEEEIDILNKVLRLLTGTGVKKTKVAKKTKGPRRKMSAAARRRISLAQKARWKKWKAKK